MEYVLYRCPAAGCKTIQADAGNCDRHQRELAPVKMVDAAPYRIAERSIRAIAGGHIENPTAMAVETMDAMYPALAALDTESGFAKGRGPKAGAGDPTITYSDKDIRKSTIPTDTCPAHQSQGKAPADTESAERVRNMEASDPVTTHSRELGPPNIQSQQGGD